MLTRTLARELAPNIRVNSVSPGTTIWPENDNAFDENKKAEILAKLPLKRLADPEDIAKAVYFLLTTPSITGQIINVDAGKIVSLNLHPSQAQRIANNRYRTKTHCRCAYHGI